MRHDLLPLEHRLQRYARQCNLDLHVVELDYVLSWLLQSMAMHPILSSSLVFKGGTALKKCYFGEYRFSEDLDFTALPQAPSVTQLDEHIASVVATAEQCMNVHAPVSLIWSNYEEKQVHPHGQRAYKVRAQLPGHREPLISAMIEISFSEKVLFSCETRPIIHPYGEQCDQKVLVYALEEIVVEKLRAILQHTKKLHERGWTRSRTRDYYDLYRIAHFRPGLFASKDLLPSLLEKCADKEVSVTAVGDFFDPRFLKAVRQDWEQHLGHLLTGLPALEEVLDILQRQLSFMFTGS